MRKKLRELISRKESLLVPFAYDAFSAMLVQNAGFPAVGISGSAVAASLFGVPDVGLLSREDIVSHARRIVEAVNIPVIADADTGYGGPLQASRTIKHFESAGVAGIFMEDQEDPKKCGHLEGIKVISKRSMIGKLEAVLHERVDPDFVVIARTDSISVEGIKGAADRANSYINAGADLAFVSGFASVRDVQEVSKLVNPNSLMIVMTEGGKTPIMPMEDLEDLGYKLIGYSGLTLGSAGHAINQNLEKLRNEGNSIDIIDRVMPLTQRNEILKLSKFQEIESKFLIED